MSVVPSASRNIIFDWFKYLDAFSSVNVANTKISSFNTGFNPLCIITWLDYINGGLVYDFTKLKITFLDLSLRSFSNIYFNDLEWWIYLRETVEGRAQNSDLTRKNISIKETVRIIGCIMKQTFKYISSDIGSAQPSFHILSVPLIMVYGTIDYGP